MTGQLLPAFVAALTLVATGITVQADSPHRHGQVSTQLQVQIAPPVVDPHRSSPKLGVMAFTSNGAVEVDRVMYNTPAKRLGLEAGDRIVEINGHSVRSVYDMQRALRDAVNYHDGQIRVLVDNVRARYGQSSQRYVTVRTYLDGFRYNNGGRNNPVPVYTRPAPEHSAVHGRHQH